MGPVQFLESNSVVLVMNWHLAYPLIIDYCLWPVHNSCNTVGKRNEVKTEVYKITKGKIRPQTVELKAPPREKKIKIRAGF